MKLRKATLIDYGVPPDDIPTLQSHLRNLSESDKYKKADIMAQWLKENGKSHCTGCEPLNAYVADNPKILTKKDFKY